MRRNNTDVSNASSSVTLPQTEKKDIEVGSQLVESYKPAKWSELCKPILTMWQLGGLYVPPKSLFTKIYTIILIALMTVNVARLVPSLRFELSQNVLTIAWLILTLVCQIYFAYVSMSGKMDKLFHELDKLETKSFAMGFPLSCLQKIKILFIVQTVLFFILFLINNGATYYSIFHSDLLGNLVYPFENINENSLEAMLLRIFNYLICIVSGFNWTMTLCIFSILADILKYNFIVYRRSFESNLNDKGKFKKCFLQFWICFKEHADVLETGNGILKLYICFTFLFGILGMTTLIYILVNFSRCFDIISLLACVYWLLVSAFGVAIILIKGSILFDKVDDICKVLFEFIPGDMSEELWRLHQLFVTRINRGDMGFTCAGLFVINRETSLTVIGALLTYAVVLIQFGSTSVSDPCPMKNNTVVTGQT